jgi:hypothetical protein
VLVTTNRPVDGFVSISALEADRDLDPSTDRWLRSLTRQLG